MGSEKEYIGQLKMNLPEEKKYKVKGKFENGATFSTPILKSYDEAVEQKRLWSEIVDIDFWIEEVEE